MSRKPLSVRNSADNAHFKHPGGEGKKRKSRTPFPVLGTSTLVTQLNFILAETMSSRPLVEEDLTKPTAERIQEIYLLIVLIFYEINVDAFKQVSFKQASEIEHHDLLEDFTNRIQFFRAVKMLMRTSLVNDFTIKDLYTPDPARVHEQLSGFMNYFKFHHQCLDCVGEDLDKIQAIESERVKCVEENDALRARLSDMERKRQLEEREEEEVKSRLQSQQQAMQEKQGEERALKLRYQQECERHDRLEQRNAELERVLEKKTTRITDLRNEVVTSPEKIRSTLGRLEEQNAEASASLRDIEGLQKNWEALATQALQIPEAGIMKSLKESLDAVTQKVEAKSKLVIQSESIMEEVKQENQLLQEATSKLQTNLHHLKIAGDDLEREEYHEGKVGPSRVLEDYQRDVLLLREQLNQREISEENFRHKADELEKKMAGFRQQLKKVSSEKTEMAAVMMKKLHHQLDVHQQHIKALTNN